MPFEVLYVKFSPISGETGLATITKEVSRKRKYTALKNSDRYEEVLTQNRQYKSENYEQFKQSEKYEQKTGTE